VLYKNKKKKKKRETKVNLFFGCFFSFLKEKKWDEKKEIWIGKS